MLDKIKSGLNLFIVFMFIVSILYGTIVIILNAFKPKEQSLVYINEQNIDIYKTKEKLVAFDYSTFYTIESCLQSVITALNDNQINNVYNVLTTDAKKQIGNNKNKLTEYYENNFKYEVLPGLEIEGYQNRNNLKKLYKIENNEYLAVLASNNSKQNTNIGIRLKNNYTYEIFYIEI